MFRDDPTPPELDPDVWASITAIRRAHSHYYEALSQSQQSGALTGEQIDEIDAHLKKINRIVDDVSDEYENAFDERLK